MFKQKFEILEILQDPYNTNKKNFKKKNFSLPIDPNFFGSVIRISGFFLGLTSNSSFKNKKMRNYTRKS